MIAGCHNDSHWSMSNTNIRYIISNWNVHWPINLWWHHQLVINSGSGPWLSDLRVDSATDNGLWPDWPGLVALMIGHLFWLAGCWVKSAQLLGCCSLAAPCEDPDWEKLFFIEEAQWPSCEGLLNGQGCLCVRQHSVTGHHSKKICVCACGCVWERYCMYLHVRDTECVHVCVCV